MAATVYIIRHAEAEGNLYRRAHGWYNSTITDRCHGLYDSLLTPRAYQQLPCLAKRFENVPLAAVYASPLFRARTTAQAVAAPHGLTVELRNDLHEIDMGDWEDLPWAELPHGWPDQYAKWCARPWEAAPPHGETVMQAGARMLNEVRRLAQENDGKAIAVVTHGSAIRGALTIAHGFPPEKMNEIGWGDNTCVARLDFADDGSIDVVYENDASHLPQELSTFACIGWKNAKGIPVSPQIWFRRADPKNPQDVDKIMGFMRELHRNAYGTDVNLDPDALIRDVERAQKISPRACTFGCLESGEEVALVYLKTWWEEQPEIGLVGGFCIAGDYRGCGLSGQILGQAISVYRALGKRELCARVAEKNMRAQGFYHKFGFLQRGEYRDENGLHYQMVKPISVE